MPGPPGRDAAVVHRGEQRNARIHLHDEPDHEQRDPEIAHGARQEPPVAHRRDRRLRARRARQGQRQRSPKSRSRRIGQQVGDAGVACRKKHLQRFHRERQQSAGDDRDRQGSGRRAPVLRGCDEETERQVRDEVADDVVAHPPRRPRREQEERGPRCPLEPWLERLQARVEDGEAVEPGEEHREQRARWRGRHHDGTARQGGPRDVRADLPLSDRP